MPCLTTQEIIQINNFLNTVKETLQQWASPGSRFYELDAYSFLGGFLPCGRVPQADDEIFSANQRIENINSVLQILASARDEELTDPTDPTSNSGCEELITAINALSAKLDLTTTINNALNAWLPVLIAALAPSFTEINNNIDNSTEQLNNNIVTVNENVNTAREGINDTRIELREARERLIVIQGDMRDIEILERIHDTRTELREARERLIVIEECVCPRIEPGSTLDVDDLISRLMIQINEALDAQAILIFASLYDQMILMETRLNTKIDEPAWLPGINAKLDLIIELLRKLDEILDFLRDLDLYLRTNIDRISNNIDALINSVDNIDATVSSIATALSILRNTVNEIDNNVDIIRTLVQNLTTISNNILNQIQNINNQNNNDTAQIMFTLGSIISLLGNLQQDVDRLQPPTLNGNTTAIGCLSTDIYNYSGTGFIGISSQLSSLTNQLNKLHSELCPLIQEEELIEGELVTIDCTDTNNIIQTPYSGRGFRAITAALEVNSNNNLKILQEICNQKEEEPNCFVIQPSDVDEELNYPRQLVIHWKVDDDTIPIEQSHWQSTVPLPIANLDWETHFENLRWVRGNTTGRWYLQNSTARLGGYFLNEQEALNTLNQLIDLTTLNPKTPQPRITTGGSTFITSTGVITKPYKVVLADKIDNKWIPIQCFTPNN